MNLPNSITVCRFGIAIAFFVTLAMIETRFEHVNVARSRAWYDLGLILFSVAALSDFLDGYIARKQGTTTVFGRVSDPLVDKILVGGAFIYFVALEGPAEFVSAWMVIVILSREFIVSGLRSAAESRGIPFGATFWGKQKMVIQCMTVMMLLFYCGTFSRILLGDERVGSWIHALCKSLVWATVVSTVVSGLAYVVRIRRLWAQI